MKEGPDLDRYGDPEPEKAETLEQANEVRRFIRRWRYRRLIPVEDHLPGELADHFEEWRKEFGMPAHPGFHVVREEARRVPAESPKTAEELAEVSFQEIIDFLDNWKASGEFTEPSMEGLGRQLSKLIADDPRRFTPHAELFDELDPVYVREFIDGLEDAVREGESVEWEPVLSLCRSIAVRPREIPEREVSNPMVDKDWGWTRKAIADLLGAGFQEGNSEIPHSLRAEAWRVIELLTRDEEPDLGYEKKVGGSNMEPANRSINTVRGQAMHAVIRYALWIRRHLEAADAQERIDRGFEEMPEVREVLEEHLDPAVDPTLTIRAVYGQWLPWLVLLDRGWTEKNRSCILPHDSELRRLWYAAWDTYISISGAYNNVFEVLRPEYEFALQLIGSGGRMSPFDRHPDEFLGSHLIAFYWRGRLDLDEEGILSQFFAKASPELRGLVLHYAGRGLKDAGEEAPPEVIERSKRFWSWRLESVRSEEGDAVEELAYFGEWFISGVFEDEWAITQLHEALRLAKRLEGVPWVLECLKEMASAFPLECAECVKLIAEADQEDWPMIGSNLKHAYEILNIALQAKDARTRDKAEQVANLFMARGHFGFRALLQPDEESSQNC